MLYLLGCDAGIFSYWFCFIFWINRSLSERLSFLLCCMCSKACCHLVIMSVIILLPCYYVPGTYDFPVVTIKMCGPAKTSIELMYFSPDDTLPQSTPFLVFTSYIHGPKKKKSGKYTRAGFNPTVCVFSHCADPFPEATLNRQGCPRSECHGSRLHHLRTVGTCFRF